MSITDNIFTIPGAFRDYALKYTMSASKITQKDLDHIAKLARIELSSDEKETFLPQLSSVLDYLDILNKADTQNVEPTYRVNDQKNIFHIDEIKESLSQKEGIKTAPKTKDGYFVVTGTIKK